jgi:hypothetical protein
MKNVHIMKLGAIVTLVSFLFLPVAGCGSMTVSGFDVFKMNDISAGVKIFAGIAMILALAILFVPNKSYVFFSGIAGIVSLVIAYMIAKGKMSSGNDFGMSDAIDLKSGSYLSMIGFAVSAVVSKMKNEIFSSPPEKPEPTQEGDKNP